MEGLVVLARSFQQKSACDGSQVCLLSGTSWMKQSSSSEPKITRCWCVNSNLGFGRFLGSDGSTASEAGDVLLFLFSGFEDLHE